MLNILLAKHTTNTIETNSIHNKNQVVTTESLLGSHYGLTSFELFSAVFTAP